MANITGISDYIVIDVETTGFSPEFDSIIQFSAIKISGGMITDSLSSYIHIDYPIPSMVSELTGITDAILKDAPIILLDEATAYADPENEGKILDSFSQLIKGKTVMVIAHRLSTIRNAEQILVIDKGTVAELGKHDELIALGGLYKNMWDIYSRSREWKLNR